MTQLGKRCPICGLPAIPIVYGLPSWSLMDAAEAGDIEAGGCMVDDVNPSWACTDPENPHRWGSMSEDDPAWVAAVDAAVRRRRQGEGDGR